MFITFEGIEGCGKSTQSRMVRDHLQASGVPVVWTREPGGCELGVRLRAMLLGREGADLTAHAELFLYLADRAQHVAEVIRPALAEGRIVLCDRFTDSTVAYQGYGRGLDLEMLHAVNQVAVNGCLPDLTIILDLPVETGLARARSRNEEQDQSESEGRFEAESLAFHQRIRDGYLALSAVDRTRYAVIPANGSPDQVFSKILPLLSARLGLKTQPA
ncbi:dTMP kinase [Desulfonatronum thiosulfatophilum]|uniref:Thymidylate kinase n=1 Tax=Desulfonatronum thiosulfatophilum TaxID=617002 RepID=A0A1G6AZA2_9BACT|nr:dTMP kinase [Desulfonatronum thiosulfatophilum]SDB13609.1 dTMP kinase [Desulfonatronum thiosulfatophilum]